MTAPKAHRCTESCRCPACGSDMFYAQPTTSRRGEHACVDPACVFAGGEHDAAEVGHRIAAYRAAGPAGR